MKNGRKLIVVIHTSFVSVADLKALFQKKAPHILTHHIVDDSLLSDVMHHGQVTPEITRRICQYAKHAEEIGADLIFNQCSSIGESVNVARKVVSVPIVKVDEAMADKAVKTGRRIAVVATVESTLFPSTKLVREAALNLGREVEIHSCLVEGALDVLMKEGDRDRHNAMVLDRIREIDQEYDVILLAQGSMVVLLPHLESIRIPVLSSPEIGVERAVSLLQ